VEEEEEEEVDSSRTSAVLVVVAVAVLSLHSDATRDVMAAGPAIERLWSGEGEGSSVVAMRSIDQATVDRLRSIGLGSAARRTLVASEATGMVEDLGTGQVVALHVHSLLP
jgi:hypothetical protein